jgi:hypothetical protein
VTKADLFNQLLTQWPQVRVMVATDRPGVVLPKGLPGIVGLDYGLNMAVPIHDLEVNEEGVRATLSFGRLPFSTFVPWSAVFAFVDPDGNGIGFPELAPIGTLTAEAPGAPAPVRDLSACHNCGAFDEVTWVATQVTPFDTAEATAPARVCMVCNLAFYFRNRKVNRISWPPAAPAVTEPEPDPPLVACG